MFIEIPEKIKFIYLHPFFPVKKKKKTERFKNLMQWRIL